MKTGLGTTGAPRARTRCEAGVGLGFSVWALPTVAVAGILFDLGGRLCGQSPETSPWHFGQQGPLCWRCTGRYGFLLGGLPALVAFRLRAPVGSLPGRLAALVLGCLATALDVFALQTLVPNNLTRVATGALVGLAAPSVVFESVRTLLGKEPA